MWRIAVLLSVGVLLSACGDGSEQMTGFSCRATNISLGECLNSHGIIGHEHRVVAQIIFDGDYKYRTYPRGEQCFVEYTIDTERNGKHIEKQFECEVPKKRMSKQ